MNFDAKVPLLGQEQEIEFTKAIRKNDSNPLKRSQTIKHRSDSKAQPLPYPKNDKKIEVSEIEEGEGQEKGVDSIRSNELKNVQKICKELTSLRSNKRKHIKSKKKDSGEKKTEENHGESSNEKNKNKDKEELKDTIRNVRDVTLKFIKKPLKEYRLPQSSDYKDFKEIDFMTLSPDQSKVLTCYQGIGIQGGKICIFDIYNEKNPKVFDLKKTPLCAAYNSIGNHIIIGCDKGIIRLIDLHSDEENNEYIRTEDKHPIRVVAFSGRGKHLFFGGDSGKLYYTSLVNWEPEYTDGSPKEKKKTDGSPKEKKKISWKTIKKTPILHHKGGILAFVYCAPRKLYASGGSDAIIKLFNIEEQDNELKVTNLKRLSYHKDDISALVFSNDGKYLLSGSYDKTAKLYAIDEDKEALTYRGHKSFLFGVAISPDSKHVLTSGMDNTARLYDRETGELKSEYIDEREEQSDYLNDDGGYDISAVYFLGDGSKIITAGEQGVVKVFSIEQKQFFRGQSRHRNLDGETACINSIDVDFSFKLVLTGGDDGLVRLYNIENAFEMRKFQGNEGEVYVVRFSPDSKIVLSGGEDAVLRMYDTFSGSLICCYQNNKRSIYSIIFLPKDDNIYEFAVGGDDKKVDIYNCLTRERLRTIPSQIDSEVQEAVVKPEIYIRCMLYSPDKKWVIVGGYDNDFIGSICAYSIDGKEAFMLDLEPQMSTVSHLEMIGSNILVALDNEDHNMQAYKVTDFDKSGNEGNMEKIELLDFKEEKYNNEYVFNSIAAFPDKYPDTLFCLVGKKSDNNCYKPELLVWKLEKDELLCPMNPEDRIEIPSVDNINKIKSKISLPDKNYIFFGTSEGIPRKFLFEIEKEKKLCEKPFANYSNQVKFLAINNDDEIAIVDDCNEIRIIHLIEEKIKTIETSEENDNTLSCLKFGKDDKEFLVGTEAGIHKFNNNDEAKISFAVHFKKKVVLIESTENDIFVLLENGEIHSKNQGFYKVIFDIKKHEPKDLNGVEPILLCPSKIERNLKIEEVANLSEETKKKKRLKLLINTIKKRI